MGISSLCLLVQRRRVVNLHALPWGTHGAGCATGTTSCIRIAFKKAMAHPAETVELVIKGFAVEVIAVEGD